ncbi:MAG: ribbon-helix-helix protein, CopG family [Actinobacteria bacterium]|nr:ribbon-helix-helix protein, CopG family [Actinomycetota bacterium]
MARKQVLVQLDDAIVDRLDRSAEALELNRSELIRQAVGAYLDACEEAAWDARTVRAYLEVPEDLADLDGLRRLAATAWPEP